MNTFSKINSALRRFGWDFRFFTIICPEKLNKRTLKLKHWLSWLAELALEQSGKRAERSVTTRFQKPFGGQKLVTTGMSTFVKIKKSINFWFKTQNPNFMGKNCLISQSDQLTNWFDRLADRFLIQNSNMEWKMIINRFFIFAWFFLFLLFQNLSKSDVF
jgi:hypothetical protein